MDEQKMVALIVDLHRDGGRQGPGSDAETRRALGLARIDRRADLQVADIGCGTGASTRVLAEALPSAQIAAVDLVPEFLDVLEKEARDAGVGDRIDVLEASMDDLPFDDDSLDLIWAEGAIYNMGFRAGLDAWRPLLRPGGVLAVSEITWLHPNPPKEIREYWEAEYPEIATASAKISVLEDTGYDLLGYSVLPPTCWLDEYYTPLERRFPDFLDRHAHEPEAATVVEMERREIDLYKRYRDAYSYGFYIAKKRRG